MNWTVSKALGMDWNDISKLSLADLRGAVRSLADAGNKRIKDIESKLGGSPATRYIREEGRFSTRGLSTRQELLKEYAREKRFFNAETSSVRGAKQVRNETMNTLKEEYDIDVDVSNYDKFWRAYEELKKLDKEIANKGLKYKVQSGLATILNNNRGASVEELVQEMRDKIADIKAVNEGTGGFQSVGDFISESFEILDDMEDF